MRTTRTTRLRRAAAVAAVAGATVLAPLGVASPAHAVFTPGCERLAGIGQDGTTIVGFHFRFCRFEGTETPLGLTIKKRVGVSTFVPVASGSGEVVFQCTGTDRTTYVIVGSGINEPPLTANCS